MEEVKEVYCDPFVDVDVLWEDDDGLEAAFNERGFDEWLAEEEWLGGVAVAAVAAGYLGYLLLLSCGRGWGSFLCV